MQFFYDPFLPRCQGTFFHKNSQYFLHKILLTIFGLPFFTPDFYTFFSRISFIRNSKKISHKNFLHFLHKILLTIFSVKDLHFLLNKNSYHFSILNFYRKSFFKARMHCCAGPIFGGFPPSFLSTQCDFW